MAAMLPTPSDGSLPEKRISDADRGRVIDVLKTCCSEGRLTLDEFSERVGATWAAQTVSQLSVVLVDLPHPFGPDLTGVVAGPAGSRVSRAASSAPATRWTVSVMSGSRRRGRWRLRQQTNAVAIMGGCELDLRRAEVEGSVVVINAVALMGGIDIVVPEGIEVELSGIGLMGSKEARIKDVPILPGSPIVRVRALALMGEVTVRSRSLEPEKRRRLSPRRERRRGWDG
jgi:hypothetical protein